MKAAALLLCAVPLALAGCGELDMYSQRKSDTWDKSPFLAKGTSMQLPPPGTVPRDEPNLPVPQPTVVTAALIERGHQRFDIFCTPCHGYAGRADGMIVQRGFPKPPLFTEDRLMKAKAQHFYDVITNGKDAMFSYADRVPPSDRWAIAAYVRALQLSQAPVVASLSPDERKKLDEGAR